MGDVMTIDLSKMTIKKGDIAVFCSGGRSEIDAVFHDDKGYTFIFNKCFSFFYSVKGEFSGCKNCDLNIVAIEHKEEEESEVDKFFSGCRLGMGFYNPDTKWAPTDLYHLAQAIMADVEKKIGGK